MRQGNLSVGNTPFSIWFSFSCLSLSFPLGRMPVGVSHLEFLSTIVFFSLPPFFLVFLILPKLYLFQSKSIRTMIYSLIEVLGAAVSCLVYCGNSFFFKGEGRLFTCYSRLDPMHFVAQFIHYFMGSRIVLPLICISYSIMLWYLNSSEHHNLVIAIYILSAVGSLPIRISSVVP